MFSRGEIAHITPFLYFLDNLGPIERVKLLSRHDKALLYLKQHRLRALDVKTNLRASNV
jgi:hypothetical protein